MYPKYPKLQYPKYQSTVQPTARQNTHGTTTSPPPHVVPDGGAQRRKLSFPVQNHQLGSHNADICSGPVTSYPKMATDRYTHRVTSVAPSGGRSWDRVGVLVLTLQSVRHQHTRGVPGAKWASLDMPLNFLQQPSKLLHVIFFGGGLDGPAGSPKPTRHGAVPSPP